LSDQLPPPYTGNKHQILIANRLFNSPSALSTTVKQLLHGQPLNQPFAGADDELLRDWVKYHADADRKIGAGVDHFYVDEHIDYGRRSRCIRIKRLDGTTEDISYKEPSRGLVQLRKHGTVRRNPRDIVTDFKNALRRTVEEQCLYFKEQAFALCGVVVCEITGAELTFTEADVDHRHPMTFDAIAFHWSLLYAINPHNCELVDNGTYFTLADQALADAFAGFHFENANLRVISRDANIAAERFPCDWEVYL
jgi:hypothetical protein